MTVNVTALTRIFPSPPTLSSTHMTNIKQKQQQQSVESTSTIKEPQHQEHLPAVLVASSIFKPRCEHTTYTCMLIVVCLPVQSLALLAHILGLAGSTTYQVHLSHLAGTAWRKAVHCLCLYHTSEYSHVTLAAVLQTWSFGPMLKQSHAIDPLGPRVGSRFYFFL